MSTNSRKAILEAARRKIAPRNARIRQIPGPHLDPLAPQSDSAITERWRRPVGEA